MFTGIVEETGTVKNIIKGSASCKLTISCDTVLKEAKIGDSIAVNGICLTVTTFESNYFTADVMPETMRKTNLGELKINHKVNLERALRLSDRLGGHILSGHIDGTGTITKIQREDNATWITIDASRDIMKYIIQKGSVALDGASLTVAGVYEESFEVSIIPHTMGRTILESKSEGDLINIECDLIGKYIEKLLASQNTQGNNIKKGISMDFLRENGF